jgi:hypothetical protein
MKVITLPSWLKIATWLLLGSLITFSFKKPTLFWQNANINDLLLATSFFCLLVAWYKKQIKFSIPRWVIVSMGLIFATQLIGTAISAFQFNTFAPGALREYSRIIAAFIIAIEVYVIGIHNQRFVTLSLWALAVSSIVLPFVFYMPPSVLHFFLDESQTRFTGLLYDPNYFATLQLLPTFILLWLALDQSYARNMVLRITCFILFSYSVSSIIWSGSRGGVFGLIIGLGVLALFFMWKLPIRRSLLTILLVIVGCLLAYVIVPRSGKENITSRAQTIVIKTDTQSPLVHSLPQNSIFKKIAEPVARLSARQGRFQIWQSAVSEFMKNPFGYGPDYGNSADIQGADNDHHRVAHNSVLQILLTGGIAFFALSVFVIFVFLKKVIVYKGPFGEIHYLVASLIGIGAAALFLDSLWSRWIWIMIALIAVLRERAYPTMNE